MHLVILIPCLNEEKTIASVIDSIPKEIKRIKKISILIVDDGSTDRTKIIAEKCGAKVISHKRNLGVGGAFHTGIDECINIGANIVVNMDGDGQFNPLDIPALIDPILDEKVDCTTASRFMKKEYIPQMPFIKKWGNFQMARLVSFLVDKKFFDVSCGFRAYSGDTVLKLNLFGKFTYTQETFIDLIFKDCKILEIPLKIRGEREFGKSRVASSVINYAINTSKIIVRSFRDYKPLKFFLTIALLLSIPGLLLGSFFFYHYAITGQFTGHLWAGFLSAFLIIFSFLFLVTSLITDMFVRIRQNQEYLIYMQKKQRKNIPNG